LLCALPDLSDLQLYEQAQGLASSVSTTKTKGPRLIAGFFVFEAAI
jgi:hypothetical protein